MTVAPNAVATATSVARCGSCNIQIVRIMVNHSELGIGDVVGVGAVMYGAQAAVALGPRHGHVVVRAANVSRRKVRVLAVWTLF